jgi:hypothetical protein
MAATLMNESSSRSHTIVSINFVQKIQIAMEYAVVYSVRPASSTAAFISLILPVVSASPRQGSIPRTA